MKRCLPCGAFGIEPKPNGLKLFFALLQSLIELYLGLIVSVTHNNCNIPDAAHLVNRHVEKTQQSVVNEFLPKLA